MAGVDAHFYEPVNGHSLPHDPFNAMVGPRPIGWISSLSADGIANLAPYSFFNGLSYAPPLIGFSSIGWKDSVANIKVTREFCWNLATKALAEAMNLSCAPAPPEVDEFEVAGLTKAPGRLVSAPRVMESPVNFECRLSEIIRLKGADGRESHAWLTIGEVVGVWIDRAFIKDGVYDTAATRPILRAGGLGDYFEITPEAGFAMRRPGWPIEGPT
ncbi:MAG TPA: flavin reductase family protein [Caulobacteraceae bacterium]|jgi:flavin reductase (DIM6/NTAB) family NADH-FMN oxidoreductase RutF